MRRSSMLWVAFLGLLVVLVAAWIDGGEEPLREITQPVDVPEGAL